jgi:response regulator of citrate/malate metabolism
VIRVLVVEDEPVAAHAHRVYLGRVPGFEVAEVVHTGAAALRALRADREIDLVLLDFNLPDLHGLEVCRAMRAAGVRADVIAVTSALDLPTVRSAVSVGIVQYLLKPFTFASFRGKLERYADYRSSLAGEGMATGQSDVDRAFAALRGLDRGTLPPGLTEETFDAVARTLQSSDGGLSAGEVGEQCGISRVTARRYLEHLAESGAARRVPRYRRAGRPEIEYRWGSTPTRPD